MEPAQSSAPAAGVAPLSGERKAELPADGLSFQRMAEIVQYRTDCRNGEESVDAGVAHEAIDDLLADAEAFRKLSDILKNERAALLDEVDTLKARANQSLSDMKAAALDTFNQLSASRSEAAALRVQVEQATPQWIAVSERLPETINGMIPHVLVPTYPEEPHKARSAYYCQFTEKWYDVQDGFEVKTSFWMPFILPDLPLPAAPAGVPSQKGSHE